MSYEACVFVINKSIKMILTSNHCFWLKYEFLILLHNIHNIVFSSEAFHVNQERNMHRSSKWKQSKTVLNKYVCGFWCERTTLDGLFHCRKHYYGLCILARSNGLKLNVVMMDLFLTNFQLFASQYNNWHTGVVVWIIVVFLSAVWTLILTAPIHCRGSIGEQSI